MNFKLRYTALAAALIAGGFAMNASAAGLLATGNFTVTLVVNKTCAVNTSAASNINLGSVNAGGTTTVQSGAFSVNCAKTVPFFVGLAPSNASTTGAGVLTSGATTIAYQLYQNTTGTVWGNTATSLVVGNGESGTGAGMGAGNAQPFTAYANATGSTDVAPSTYTDTVTINVNY